MVLFAKAPITNHIMFNHHFTSNGETRPMPVTKPFILSSTISMAFPAQINRNIYWTKLNVNPPLGLPSNPSKTQKMYHCLQLVQTQPWRSSAYAQQFLYTLPPCSSIKVIPPSPISLFPVLTRSGPMMMSTGMMTIHQDQYPLSTRC